jgi:transposase
MTLNAEQKKQFIQLTAQKASISEIAEKIGCSVRTVSYNRKKLAETGSLDSKKRNRGPSKVTPRLSRRIVRNARKSVASTTTSLANEPGIDVLKSNVLKVL